ncbi:MAG: hypothetical protein ABIQ93_15030 [Saprospiraceae bacterium]
MKLILAVPAVGLLFSGAIGINRLSLDHPTLPTPKKEVPTLTATTPKMWAQTAPIHKGERFDLSFETPHAEYLGVIDPSGKFFYVIFPAADGQGNLKPLVDGILFTSRQSITINTATLKADPYTYGVTENQPVFTKSGTYRFLLGQTLHTDDESSVSIVRVVYNDWKRPSAPTQPAIAAN